MPHHAAAPTWIYLLVIPLLLWLRLRRARRAVRATDFWFEPEGGHFIYHPFGRWGGAFLVSPHARDQIRARMAVFAKCAAAIFTLMALGPMLLMSIDPAAGLRLRPLFLAFRLAMIGLILLGGLAWRVIAVRPLYANAPPAPRRIDHRDARARALATRSRTSLVISAMVVGVFGTLVLLEGIEAHSPPLELVALALMVVFAFRLRALYFKLAPRRPIF